MSTLIAVSGLGIVSLLLEILNLRKILVPVILLGLVAILGLTVSEFYLGESFFNIDNYGMVVSTSYSRGFSSLFIVLALFIILMSPKFYETRITKIADYVSLIVFMLAGAVAMVSFANLSMFFIGIEVLSISAYILASSNPSDKKSNEAGVKYFILGAFASSFILFGIALVYGAVGSFNIDTIIATSLSDATLSIWYKIGFIMIAVGLFFKAGVVPFHFWAPDVYEGSPTLVTAAMSTLVKVAAIATLYKVFGIFVGAMTPVFQTVVVILTILTLCVGNITALRQRNLKRLMAFSGISHAGFMMMDLLANGFGTTAILYYACAYGFAGIAGFAVIMAVCGDKDCDVSNIYGLAKEKMYLAVILTCAFLSLGGIPIFAGFFAKLFMFNLMINSGYLILVIFGVINSIIAIYYYFGTANVMFTKDTVRTEALKIDVRYAIVAIVAIVLNIAIGLFPSLIMGTNM